MIGETISHYRITAELGAGGMGVVYEAEDLRLERKVALKFLSHHLASDPDAKARFVTEARAASALDHPNICTVHEIDETEDGSLFIAMTRYVGETLKERLARGRLPVDEAASIARQIASGLTRAHGRGIIHRDIKPANIFITEHDEVKILDFGLAKLAGETRITTDGSTMGTVAYMAPEQARAEVSDHRADIWSLGAVLYEMLAGRLPFPGEHPQALIYAIQNENPTPLVELRSETPTDLARVVERCLDKDVDRRTADAGELAAELGGTGHGVQWFRRRQLLALAATGAALVIVGALALPRLIGQLTASDGYGAIAVMPLIALTTEEREDLFADGITGDLIASFNRMEGLERVAARTRVMRYKETDLTPREVGKELDVDALVYGTVQLEGDQLHITAELLDADTEDLLWMDSFDGRLLDVLRIQGQIAREIAQAISIRIAPETETALATAREVDPEAYEAYVWGMRYSRRWTTRNLRTAVDFLTKAVKIDSTYVPAVAGLGRALAISGLLITPKYFEPAGRVANQAIALDENSADAHVAQAWVKLYRDWDWVGAQRSFDRANELTPRAPHPDYSQFCKLAGRNDEGVAVAKYYLEQDPLDPDRHFEHAYYLWNGARFDEAKTAMETMRRAFASDVIQVAKANEWIIYSLAALGEHERALAMVDSLQIDTSYWHMWDWFYMSVGDTARGLRHLRGWIEAESENPQGFDHYIALIYMIAGDLDSALPWLEKALERRAPMLTYINTDFQLIDREILYDPRFRALHDRVGAPWPDWLEEP